MLSSSQSQAHQNPEQPISGDPNPSISPELLITLLGNEDEVIKFYRFGAEKENSDDQLFLGTCYEKGIGTPKDEKQAMEWYKKAAKRNDTARMNYARLLKKIMLPKSEPKPHQSIQLVPKAPEISSDEAKKGQDRKEIPEEVTTYDSKDPLFPLKVLISITKNIKVSDAVFDEAKRNAQSIKSCIGKPEFWKLLCEGFLYGHGRELFKELQSFNLVTTIFGANGHASIWKLLEWHIGELDRQYKFNPALHALSSSPSREVQLYAWFILKVIRPYQLIDDETIKPIAAVLGIPHSAELCESVTRLFTRQLEIFVQPKKTDESASERKEEYAALSVIASSRN